MCNDVLKMKPKYMTENMWWPSLFQEWLVHLKLQQQQLTSRHWPHGKKKERKEKKPSQSNHKGPPNLIFFFF